MLGNFLQIFAVQLSVSYFLAALVHSGCYNKIPHTEWLVNNRMYFYGFWGGEANIKAQTDLVSSEAHFLVDGRFFPAVLLPGTGARQLPAPLRKGQIPFMSTLRSWPITSLRGWAPANEFWENTSTKHLEWLCGASLLSEGVFQHLWEKLKLKDNPVFHDFLKFLGIF